MFNNLGGWGGNYPLNTCNYLLYKRLHGLIVGDVQ